MAWNGFGNVRASTSSCSSSAGWLVSLCLHEYAHALVAYRAGDLGVAERGYLTLNPLKYTHPLLSIVLPVRVPAARRHRPARRRGLDRPARDPRPAAAHA